MNKSLKVLKLNWILIVIVILIAVGWFYWFQWKPSQITKNCHIKAQNQAVDDYTQIRWENFQEKNYKANDYDRRYKDCMRANGFMGE